MTKGRPTGRQPCETTLCTRTSPETRAATAPVAYTSGPRISRFCSGPKPPLAIPPMTRRPGESSLSRSISTSAGKLKGSASMSSAESAGDCTSEKVGGQPVNVTPSGVRLDVEMEREDLGAGHIGQPEGDCRLAFDFALAADDGFAGATKKVRCTGGIAERDGRSVASDRDGGARRKSMRGWPSCRGGRARRRRPRRARRTCFRSWIVRRRRARGRRDW